MKNKYLPFYLIVFTLFFALTAKSLFTDGMFMDGLWYAAISRNLSEGMGSFWDLYFSQTIYQHFHEHPPLAFGLQSILFSIFGDHILVERFYSFFTFIITGWIITLIWRKTTAEKYRNMAWLPLLFWVIIPLNTWCVSNNLLENTMMIFTGLSVLFIIESREKKRWLKLSLAGVMIYLAFITKGPVALFPLSLPFWIFAFNKNFRFKDFITDTMIIVAAAVLSVFIVYLIFPESFDSLLIYFDKQVIGSLRNAQTVDSRFYILWNLFNNLIPVLLLMLIVFFATIKSKISSDTSKWVYIFLGLGLSGVIPIMISMKQSSFYMLASIPFFSILLADLIAPRIWFLIDKIDFNGKGFKRFKYISSFLLFAVITFTILQADRVDRDKVLIKDVRSIIEVVDDNSTVAIPHEIWDNWTLHGYFLRYGKVSLDFDNKFNNRFLVVNKGYKGDIINDYNKYPLDMELFELYEKKTD